MTRPGSNGGVPNDRYSRQVGRDLFKKFKPFRTQTVLEQNKAGSISARPRQTIDEACAHRIDRMCEHDRHSSGYSLQRRHGGTGRGQDDIGRKRRQFSCEFALKFGIACGPANLKPHVLPFRPSQFLQAFTERRNASLSFRVVRARTHEDADLAQSARAAAPAHQIAT